MQTHHHEEEGLEIHGVPALLVPRRVFELHKWRKTRVEGVAALEPPKNVNAKTLKIDWLPLAADTYHISDDPRDYVIPEVPLVTADVPNRNMDCFSFVELTRWNRVVGRAAFQTFIGKPTHEDHDNKDPLRAKGVNFDSAMSTDRSRLGTRVRRVRVLAGFDRSKDRELAQSILKGERRAYSMGALVDRTFCSVCKQLTSGRRQCSCVGFKKGDIIRGMLKYDVCEGINFIENSSVRVGADSEAVSTEWW